MIDSPEETDWAYLAGLIDGEGYIALANGVQPRVVIAMRTEQPVRWVHETFGGCYKGPKTMKSGEVRYTWGVYSRAWVEAILHGCMPYLILKQERALEIVEACCVS